MMPLDEKIQSLALEVGDVRMDFGGALATLRNADNPKGSIDQTSAIALKLLRALLGSAGLPVPSDNIYSCVEYARTNGVMPEEIASYLHNPRIISNKSHHDKLSIVPTAHDAEILLDQLLRFCEWYHCESPSGPGLRTIYGASKTGPETVSAQLTRLERLLGGGASTTMVGAEPVVGSEVALRDHLRTYADGVLSWNRLRPLGRFDMELSARCGNERGPSRNT